MRLFLLFCSVTLFVLITVPQYGPLPAPLAHLYVAATHIWLYLCYPFTFIGIVVQYCSCPVTLIVHCPRIAYHVTPVPDYPLTQHQRLNERNIRFGWRFGFFVKPAVRATNLPFANMRHHALRYRLCGTFLPYYTYIDAATTVWRSYHTFATYLPHSYHSDAVGGLIFLQLLRATATTPHVLHVITTIRDTGYARSTVGCYPTCVPSGFSFLRSFPVPGRLYTVLPYTHCCGCVPTPAFTGLLPLCSVTRCCTTARCRSSLPTDTFILPHPTRLGLFGCVCAFTGRFTFGFVRYRVLLLLLHTLPFGLRLRAAHRTLRDTGCLTYLPRALTRFG